MYRHEDAVQTKFLRRAELTGIIFLAMVSFGLFVIILLRVRERTDEGYI